MTCLVIHPDGRLDRHDSTDPPHAGVLCDVVGGPTDWVPLAPQHGVAGWVDGDGHTKQLDRNPVGAVLLMTLGAGVQPYAGPVAITGWCRHETHPLELEQIQALYLLHSDIRAAIDGTVQNPSAWTGVVQQAARRIANAPRPTMTVASLDTFDDQLLRR